MTQEEIISAISVYLEDKIITSSENSINVSKGEIIFWGINGILKPTEEQLTISLGIFNSRPVETPN